MAETRKLAAILAADVAGYGKLTAADEERTLARFSGWLVSISAQNRCGDAKVSASPCALRRSVDLDQRICLAVPSVTGPAACRC